MALDRPFRPGKATSTLLLLLSLFCATIAIAAGPETKPVPAPKTITKEMNCPSCGMFPERYPQWHSQVLFADNTMAAFDGNKCMFRFLLNLPQDRNSSQIAAIWVRDFNSGKWIDGKTAHYVVGSKVMGPMGKELIPFADATTAEAFQKANGGNIANYNGISMGTLRPLMGGMHGH